MNRSILVSIFHFSVQNMANEMNETFMVRTSTPDILSDDQELSVEKLQTKLTQVQLKATLSDEHKRTQRHQTPPLELVIIPKTQDDIIFPNVIDLSVGGCHYTTSLSTLRKYDDSMIAVMFSGRYDLVKDEHGHYFIDRDGTHFG